ncbi:MAG: response regulator [Candidatus Cohnella colombiensis]|uniref:Response regulator n=1 Tax=Candidatus Cohnella colombiensis TaxID=3121368 RepID=A0AA95JHV4_9BACL|nr:MAG: response regulator [Cohnella sp.]
MYQLLIIDDQSILADDLADMLPWQDIGITVVHRAYSAFDAIDIMSEHPIDVVVTDIQMPGMSGLELIAEIRLKWKHTKCILLTGYADFEYTKEAMKLKSSDYLLKPVADDELMGAVSRAVVELEEEWKEISSAQRAKYTLREQLPKLREYLLLDLLTGKQSNHTQEVQRKLIDYEIPFMMKDTVHLMLVRMDDEHNRYDGESEALIEYALSNIATEIFADRLHVWHCSDYHGYTVVLLRSKIDPTEYSRSDDELNSWIELRAFELQQLARKYLKIGISILMSKQVEFPNDIALQYQSSLTNFRHFIGEDRELFVSLAKEPTRGEPQLLSELYRLPSLSQLLEIGQWQAASDKLSAIFEEIEVHWRNSPEHILEAYFMIASAIASLIHKNKKWLADTIGEDFHIIANGRTMNTVNELREWTERVVAQYRNFIHVEEKDSRSTLIHQVQTFISKHLENASLQSISEHVYLNPSYLSKVYKSETGEGISEYLLRVRMEKASVLLSQTNERIYEISVMLGYQKPSYFIGLFKKHYGITPQEYRNKIGGS